MRADISYNSEDIGHLGEALRNIPLARELTETFVQRTGHGPAILADSFKSAANLDSPLCAEKTARRSARMHLAELTPQVSRGISRTRGDLMDPIRAGKQSTVGLILPGGS